MYKIATDVVKACLLLVLTSTLFFSDIQLCVVATQFRTRNNLRPTLDTTCHSLRFHYISITVLHQIRAMLKNTVQVQICRCFHSAASCNSRCNSCKITSPGM